MRISIFSLVLFLFLLSSSVIVHAQIKTTSVVAVDDIFVPIVTNKEPEFLDEFFTKPLIFNKGWDRTVRNRIRIDPTVKIEFRNFGKIFCCIGIRFTPNEIRHWGEQQFFPSSKRIYATGVLMVEKENTLEGGRFEWLLNNQGFISFHNIVRKDHPQGWIRDWTDPIPGDTVHFFMMSDDEQLSSNPITFLWPADDFGER